MVRYFGDHVLGEQECSDGASACNTQEQPDLYSQYHEGFRRQAAEWPQQPVDAALSWLKVQATPHKWHLPLRPFLHPKQPSATPPRGSACMLHMHVLRTRCNGQMHAYCRASPRTGLWRTLAAATRRSAPGDLLLST